MVLDLHTLVLTEAVILVQLAALVHILGWRLRDIFRGPSSWALGLLSFAASQLIYLFLDHPERGQPFLFSHLPAALGCCAILIGFDDFADRGRNWRGVSWLLGLAVLDFALQTFVWSSMTLRITSFGAIQLLFIFLILPRLTLPVAGQRRFGFKLVRTLALGWAAINLLRILCAWLTPPIEPGLNQLIQLSYFFMALLFGLWLALACCLLMHERLSAGLIHATTRDALTGCHNQRGLTQLLRQESQRLVRYWSPTAIACVALDDFAGLNRRYGPAIADQALIALANAVREELRDVDGLARLSGEQFALLLLNADPPGATIVAERLRKRIQDLVVYTQAGPLWFTASIGIASLPELETELELVLKEAIPALQEARASGGNKVVTRLAPASSR